MYPSIRGKAKVNINIRLNKRTLSVIFGCARLMRSMRQIGPPFIDLGLKPTLFQRFHNFLGKPNV